MGLIKKSNLLGKNAWKNIQSKAEQKFAESKTRNPEEERKKLWNKYLQTPAWIGNKPNFEKEKIERKLAEIALAYRAKSTHQQSLKDNQESRRFLDRIRGISPEKRAHLETIKEIKEMRKDRAKMLRKNRK